MTMLHRSHLLPGWLGLIVLLAAPAPLPAAWVYESAREFFSSADLDGDGRRDLVVVDKAGGDYRLGYQTAPGVFTWAGPRASGIENVTGFSVGRMTNSGGEDLLFTSPAANRVHLLRATDPNNAGLPRAIHLPSVGPSLVVALDVGGPGNDPALDDLLVATDWNVSPAWPLHTLRNTAAGINALFDDNAGWRLALGNRVRLKPTLPWMAAAIAHSTPVHSLRLFDVSTGHPAVPLFAPGFGTNVISYVADFFNNAPLLKFLVLQGELRTNLTLRPVLEPTPGSFSFGSGTTFSFPEPIDQLFVLDGASGNNLLLIQNLGQRAAVYRFDGTNMPVLVESFTAQAGENFTGAGALGGDALMLLSGRDGATTSTSYQVRTWNGSTYIAGATGDLPALTSLSAPGNVFFFSGEPFVTNAPLLLRTLNARDWTVSLGGLPGQATAQAELFASPSNGLRNPLPVMLGPAPANTTHTLVNQYREPISLFDHGPAQGDTAGEVSFVPAPGSYAAAVNVRLQANPANATVHYRLNNSGAWTPYASPIRLFKTTTIQAYVGTAASNAKSRVKSATYTLTTAPDQIDSDGDGVPDYVEIGRGTDPKRPDSDGDGYSDLDELLRGTNPLDAGSFDTNIVERLTSFDLRVQPRPFHVIENSQFAWPGAAVRAHDLQGNLLAAATNQTILVGTTLVGATLREISADPGRRLLTLATDPHFEMTPGASPLGRELVGLMPIPLLVPPTNPYTYGGGDLALEAGAWIIAATNSLLTNRPLFFRELWPADTLVAALVEQSIGTLLFARGNTNGTNLTLFGARPADVTRTPVSQLELLSLESAGSQWPAYSLRRIALTLSNAVFAPPDADVIALRTLTTNIYRISRESNNIAAPGIAYPLPLDVLRQFLGTGTIHSNYLAARSLAPEEFSAADLAAARRAVTNLMALITPRPTTNLILRIRPGPDAGCTVLETTDGAVTWALLDRQGSAYRVLDTFNLLPGSRVQVTGFTDGPVPACAAAALEVIALDLLDVPGAPGADLDGDGLADAWEALFQVSEANGDEDGDGANNLSEFMAGTDPRDLVSHPPIAPAAALPPPTVQLTREANGRLVLTWPIPPEWVSRLEFRVLSTTDLSQPFADTGLVAEYHQGRFRVVLPPGLVPGRYFIVSMSAR